ncbi:uncharacterized protein VTP21DRAFT_5021 [Calcarisporiella thermophila]|uniref:uncharacterized protein n=1 Tax=Calcarisporiella thermophila TaxID=911321 RepID=UPI0037432929
MFRLYPRTFPLSSSRTLLRRYAGTTKHIIRSKQSPSTSPSTSPSSFTPIYSRHYQPTTDEVRSFLDRHQQFPRPLKGTTEEALVPCPHCPPKPRASRYTARIHLRTGQYQCPSCLSRGTWSDFVSAVAKPSFAILDATLKDAGGQRGAGNEISFSRPISEIEAYPEQLNEYPAVRDWMIEIGIREETLQKFGVGVAKYASLETKLAAHGKELEAQIEGEICVTFPMMGPDFGKSNNEKAATDNTKPAEDAAKPAETDLATIEYRTVRIKAVRPGTSELIAFDPATRAKSDVPCLFGYHLLHPNTEEIILTANELDCMAAFQETRVPSVSLPSLNQLPVEVVPLLERFSKIYLWLEDDVNGRSAAEKFVRKLGIHRCRIVSTRGDSIDGPRSAHEALARGSNLRKLLSEAKPLGHDQIIDFSDLRDAVYREVLHPDQVCGTPFRDFPALTNLLKGHRPGELTVFTGRTGIGKTTTLCQLSLDIARQGIPTLWGSFEIPNVRLAKKLLMQLAERDLSTVPEEFDVWANELQRIPMYFLRFFGSTDINTVEEAMLHALHAYDVQHVLIDNLQFMLSGQRHSSLERWELQDEVLARFRQFATQQNVHVTLVVHPRKDENPALSVNSIFGSAKVTQEADNVVVIQQGEKGVRYLEVLKNRFDGTLGRVPFVFDRESLKIREIRDDKIKY